MSYLFAILIFLVCLLLIAVVLIQNPKGGGLSSAFGTGGTQLLGGVKKATDVLDRATWVLAGSLIALVLMTNLFTSPAETASDQEAPTSLIKEQIDNNATPSAPALGTPASSETPAATEGMPEPVSDEAEE
ncbi:preprotein translocase subunit SecG [bacterium]|nr:preprotein translocase subunit SecG [bacterium]